MKWLLWREFRLNLVIILTGLFLLIAPIVIAMIAIQFNAPRDARVLPFWLVALAGGAAYGFALNQLTFALLGGNAFAGERSDGSAEFMAYLPVTRTKRLLAKLLLAAIVAMVISGVDGLAVACLFPYLDGLRNVDSAVVGTLLICLTGLTFFSVGWLVSAIQSTPTFAVAAGLFAPFLLVMTLQSIVWVNQFYFSNHLSQWYVGVGYVIGCLLMTVVSFPLGTWFFLRRVEP